MTNYAMALQPVVQKDMEKPPTRFANEGVRGFGQKKDTTGTANAWEQRTVQSQTIRSIGHGLQK